MRKVENVYLELAERHSITEEEIREYIDGYPDLDTGDEFDGVEQGSEEYETLLYEAAIVRIATER